MPIQIIHLSDIHFKVGDAALLGRAKAIAAAVRGEFPDMMAPIVVFSGDLAFSGRADEYALAATFLEEIRSNWAEIDFVIVPGNHDCDFTKDNATRRALVNSIASGGEIDQSVIQNCTSLQDAFFDFRRKFIPDDGERLYSVIEIVREDLVLRFHGYNTAWTSKLDEKQEMILPPSLFVRRVGTADIECAVTHHPNNWLRSENARAFREHLESSVDLILTGHEHAVSTFAKVHTDGHGSNYSEAAALRGHGDCPSAFTVITIDPLQVSKRVTVFEWNEERYSVKHSSTAGPLRINMRYGFNLSSSFVDELNELGAPFTHPSKQRLRLDDLFVYPDIETRPYDHNEEEKPFISGADFATFVLDQRHVLVTGADESGKTTLAKVLFKELYTRGLRPVLVQGETVTAGSPNAWLKSISKAFRSQYDERLPFEKYAQLDIHERVLVIDDLDCARLNARGLEKFLGWCKDFFATVICFASELFEFRTVASHPESDRALLDLRPCKIKEFGYVLRGRLINKWYSIGREEEIGEEELANAVDIAEKTVDTILAGNLCPAFPVFILGILQTWEANQSVQTVSGSYGQVYEALIARALTAKGQKIPSDAKYTLLSMIAFHLYGAGKRWFDEAELNEILREYASLFGLTVEAPLLQKELCGSQMLTRTDSVYKFGHKYVFYYFTARYIRDFIADRGDEARVKQLVRELAAAVHEEDCANILIFLVYLTKSDFIVEVVIENARALFNRVSPCDLDDNVRFVNEFAKGHTREKLAIKPVEESREEHRRSRDMRTRSVVVADDRVHRDEIIQLNSALKTVQILGQILRNFPGSLRADRKLQIARETYDLGLRALNSVFDQFAKGWNEAREVVAEFLREQREYEDSYELEQSTDEFMFLLMRSFAHFFVRKISYAVGSEHLRSTYQQLLEDTPTVAIKLIDLSVRLDHFRPVNADHVVGVYKGVYKNFLASSILRRLVRDHLYLYPVPVNVKQSLCAKVEIAFDNVAFLNPGSKRLIK